MQVAYAIKKLLAELFPDDDTCTSPHSTVIAAVILSAAMTECVEHILSALEIALEKEDAKWPR